MARRNALIALAGGAQLTLMLFSPLVLPAQSVSAKAPTSAKTLTHLKLKSLKPMLDTSILPKQTHFELSVKHTDFLYPADPGKLLHANLVRGKPLVVRLRAEENDHVLRGRATMDRNDSVIKTVEYGVKPRFYVNLRALEAKLAPDISRRMDAEILAVRRKVAGEVALQQRVMDRELKARQPKPYMPATPLNLRAGVGDANPLNAGLDQARKNQHMTLKAAMQQMDAAMAQTKQPSMKIPAFPKVQMAMPEMIATKLSAPRLPSHVVPVAPRLPSQVVSAIPSLPSSVVPAVPALPSHVVPTTPLPRPLTPQRIPAVKPLTDQLVAAKLKPVDDAQLTAQLALAKKQSQASVSQAQPAMDAVLTVLRKGPPRLVPATSTSEEIQGDLSTVLQWDQWHANFAALAHDPILNAVNASGNPSGANTVEITVFSNRSMTVRLARAGNATFDGAIVKAYQSLNGNAGLRYPAGSRRSQITFLIDNQHIGNGAAAAVKSQTSIGDKEVVQVSR